MNEVDLGQLLQAARKRAGLTQQELCHRANISYSTLAKIERGAIKAPSIFTIQGIAAALQISLMDLLGDYSPAPQPVRPPSKNGVRFVYFDINGCLVQFFYRAFDTLAIDTGLAADVIETAFWSLNEQACRGDMSVADFNVAFAQKLGLSALRWEDYYFAAIDPIIEMHDLIRWVSDHYQVGLLSNIMPGFLERMLREAFIPRLAYDQIVDSSVERAVKPDMELFTIANDRAHVRPDEILFIDDSRANLIAAQKLGWKVVWFDGTRPQESTNRIREALQHV